MASSLAALVVFLLVVLLASSSIRAFSPPLLLHVCSSITTSRRVVRNGGDSPSLVQQPGVGGASSVSSGPTDAYCSSTSSTASALTGGDTTTPSTTCSTTPARHGTTKHPKRLSPAVRWRFLLESYRGNTHRYLLKLMQRHGDCFMIGKHCVVLHDAELIRDCLETHNLEKAPRVKMGYRFLFGGRGGILAAPWRRWIEQRRMTAPALAEAVVGDLAPKFERGARPVLHLLEHAAATRQAVEMDEVFTSVALDTIGLVLLGRSFGVCDRLLLSDSSSKSSSSRSQVPFSRALRVLTKEAVRQMTLPCRIVRRFPPGRRVRRAQRVVDDFLEDCVRERLRERADDGRANANATATTTTTTDMMNILLDAEEDGLIRRDDVKGQLLTFIFAGHDTTAHTLSWLLYEVARNGDLQSALHEEARAALPGRNDFPMDPDIINNRLPLLDRVWKETNRKHPAAATGTVRQVGKEAIVVGNGVELPAKATVLIPPFSLHRNEKYWPDPEKFDPSRFEKDLANPMAFQAFSAGPRNCIGGRLARAEALSLVAPLLRRFEVTCLEQREPADRCRLTRRPRNGIRFRFAARP